MLRLRLKVIEWVMGARRNQRMILQALPLAIYRLATYDSCKLRDCVWEARCIWDAR